MNKEFLRMQKLAGLITESQMNELTPKSGFTGEKYYAVVNILDEPLYLVADTKEEMLSKLNQTYKDTTGETYVPYSIEDFDDENRLPHFISDDWASVTDDLQVHNADKNNLTKNQG